MTPADLAKLTRVARTSFQVFFSLCFRDEKRRALRVGKHQMEWFRAFQEHRELVIWSSPEHGKSTVFSGAIPLWMLAHDPSLRIVIVSNTASQAVKFGRLIRETIEKNRAFQLVFPHVRPSQPWTDTTLTIERDVISKDPSVQMIGVDGAILGARVDLLILDDVLGPQNTRTPTQRQKVWEWINSSFLSRLTSRGRVLAIGTKWHREDAYHRLVQELGYYAVETPILREDGSPTWPEVWPLERIEEKRRKISQREWNRQYMLRLEAGADSWVDPGALTLAVERGAVIYGLDLARRTRAQVFCGVDLGGSEARSKSAFHVLLRDGETYASLYAESGWMRGTEVLTTIQRILGLFPGAVVAVENNATQSLVLDLIRDSLPGVAVIPVTTTGATYDAGGTLSRVAGLIEGGRWIVCRHGSGDGLDRFVQEARGYSGGHMPDELAAMVMAFRASEAILQDVAASHTRDAVAVLWGDNRPVYVTLLDRWHPILQENLPENGKVIAAIGEATSNPPERFGDKAVMLVQTSIQDSAQAIREWRSGQTIVKAPDVLGLLASADKAMQHRGGCYLHMARVAAGYIGGVVVDDEFPASSAEARPPSEAEVVPQQAKPAQQRRLGGWADLAVMGFPTVLMVPNDYPLDEESPY